MEVEILPTFVADCRSVPTRQKDIMSAAEILEQIRRLPEDEQRKVVESIEDEYAYLGDSLSSGEAEEIDRRLRDHLENPTDVVSWEEAKARLDTKSEAKFAGPLFDCSLL